MVRIRNRGDIEKWLEFLLKPYFNGRTNYVKEMGHYSLKSADFEQFSRLLIGLTSYLSYSFDEEIFSRILDELKMYIDPKSSKYVEHDGTPESSQLYVELFPPLFFLYTFKDKANDYIEENKSIINDWFSKILERKFDNNWIWFQIITNCFLYKIGVKEFDYLLNKRLHSRLESLYVSHGYYLDGPNAQLDYYNHFSFFYYSLIYVKAMTREDPEHCGKYIDKAKKFSDIYINYFNDKGRNIPEGRSLLYRFGVIGFAGALVYSNNEIIEYGYLKDLIFKAFEEWANQEIYRDECYLNNGYYYETANILEDYNAYGSPYWSLKPFVMLLGDNDAFWNAERKDFSERKRDICIPDAIIKNYEGEQYLYPIIRGYGYKCSLYSDKYEKNVYSTLFGFNISKGNQKETVSADNTVTISYDKKIFINKSFIKSEVVNDDIIRTQFEFLDTKIIQYQFIQMPFTLTVYVIDTSKPFFMREGTHSVDDTSCENIVHDGWYILKNKQHQAGIKSFANVGKVSKEKQLPNTNVFFRKSVVPVCSYNVPSGKSFHATLSYGCKEDPKKWIEPIVDAGSNNIKIEFGSIKYCIKTNQKYKKKQGKRIINITKSKLFNAIQ